MRSGRGGRLDADGVSGVLEGFGAEARISTGDVPPRQYLGSVRIDVDTRGTTRTYDLDALDRPTTDSTTQPTGE